MDVEKQMVLKNGEPFEIENADVLPAEIWRKYEGKCIIYSDLEKRVLGVGDTWDEASLQARASGVGGLWHYHRAARWGVENS